MENSLHRGIGFEYVHLLSVVRHRLLYQLPKRFLVVLMAYVCQLMYYHILYDFQRKLHQHCIETEPVLS